MRLLGLVMLFGLGWAQPVEFGSLKIEAPPGVQVYWEGIELGTVPAEGRLTIQDIPPGKYRLELKRGQEQLLAQSIHIAAGAQQLALDFHSPSAPRPAAAARGGRLAGAPFPPPAHPASESLTPVTPDHLNPAGLRLPADAAESEAPDQRLSRQAVAAEAFPWLPLLLLGLGIAGFAAYRAWRRGEYGLPNPAPPPYPGITPPAHASGRPQVTEEQASFLEALANRESAMESGGESIRPRRAQAIDIDSRLVTDEE